MQGTLLNMPTREMENLPLIVFNFNEINFALDARIVGGIVFLPELTPMEEVPNFIVGAFNLRGKIVPVIDLDIRFGYAQKPYHLDDSVIILDYNGRKIGVIVGQVQDVRNVSSLSIDTQRSFSLPIPSGPRFVTGEIKIDDRIVSVLDHDSLIRHAEFEVKPETQALDEIKERSKFCREGTAKELEIFHQRAIDLIQPINGQKTDETEWLTVFRLGKEYFAVDLILVREFSELGLITPIPCCPDYILGDMNLRGDILTLVDIRETLSIPISLTDELKMAIVFEIDSQIIGIPVDDVMDVISSKDTGVTSVPETAKLMNEKFLKGAIPYNEKMLIILDIEKLLTQEELVINEET